MRGICMPFFCHFFLLSFIDYNMTTSVLYGDSFNMSNLNIDGHQGTIKHKVYSDTYKEINKNLEVFIKSNFNGETSKYDLLNKRLIHSEMYDLQMRYIYPFHKITHQDDDDLNNNRDKIKRLFTINYNLSTKNLVNQYIYLKEAKATNISEKFNDIDNYIKTNFFKYFITFEYDNTIDDLSNRDSFRYNYIYVNIINDLILSIFLNFLQNDIFENIQEIFKNNTTSNIDKLINIINIYENNDELNKYMCKKLKDNDINIMSVIDVNYFKVYKKFEKYFNSNEKFIESSNDDFIKDFINHELINMLKRHVYEKYNIIIFLNLLQNLKNKKTIQQPQSDQKQSFLSKFGNFASKVASKIPSMPSFSLRKSTTKGGESKQSREIIKTKERVVVRYENVKYKRNVLIKNNKRYVKINKRLVSI